MCACHLWVGAARSPEMLYGGCTAVGGTLPRLRGCRPQNCESGGSAANISDPCRTDPPASALLSYWSWHHGGAPDVMACVPGDARRALGAGTLWVEPGFTDEALLGSSGGCRRLPPGGAIVQLCSEHGYALCSAPLFFPSSFASPSRTSAAPGGQPPAAAPVRSSPLRPLADDPASSPS